jgi:polyferredoxin
MHTDIKESKKHKTAWQDKLGVLRFLCQSSFAIFCLFVGWQFYSFYLWTLNSTANSFVQRPPAVEAFLPLGALVSLKRLLLGAEFDTIHPAGLTIFIAALLIGIFLRKGFCGWICPIGFASNLAERASKKMNIMFRLPGWLDIPLLSLKYLLLGFFGYLILLRMGLESLTNFHRSSYNVISDAKMLHFFLQPSVLAGSIMLGLILFTFVIRNFWCRYICPYGALLGLLAFLSPFQIKRSPDICIDCKKCETICPASIKIINRNTVRNAECIGCLECIESCPVSDCLTLSVPYKKQISPILLPILVLVLFFTCYSVAIVTGHWNTEVPLEVFQRYYQMINEIGHP